MAAIDGEAHTIGAAQVGEARVQCFDRQAAMMPQCPLLMLIHPVFLLHQLPFNIDLKTGHLRQHSLKSDA